MPGDAAEGSARKWCRPIKARHERSSTKQGQRIWFRGGRHGQLVNGKSVGAARVQDHGLDVGHVALDADENCRTVSRAGSHALLVKGAQQGSAGVKSLYSAGEIPVITVGDLG